RPAIVERALPAGNHRPRHSRAARALPVDLAQLLAERGWPRNRRRKGASRPLAGVRSGGLAVGACDDDRVAVLIKDPQFAVGRPPWLALRRVADGPEHDLSPELACPLDRRVEVVHLEPDEDTVAVGRS